MWELFDFRSTVAEASILRGYSAMSQANWFPKLRKSKVVLSSIVDISTREYLFSTLSQNVGQQSFCNVVSYHRRTNSLPISPSVQYSAKPRNTSPPDASSKTKEVSFKSFLIAFTHLPSHQINRMCYPGRLCTLNLFSP
jgi:hypothetical protein